MKILVFTEKNDYMNVISQLVSDINKNVILDHVSECELANMTLSNPQHIVIIDDRLYGLLNNEFFEVLKSNQNKLLVLLKEKENIQRYLNMNVLDYFVSPMNWSRFNNTLKDAIKHMVRINQLNKGSYGIKKFLLKRKTDVLFIDFDCILFFEKKDRTVIIHTLEKTYMTHDSLKSIMVNLPESFVRVHSSYVANFNHVHEIVESKNRSYALTFKDYEKEAHMSRQRAAEMMQDKLGYYRLSFIGHKRKDS